MSRLKRNIARRDKAWTLLERSRDGRQMLNVEPKLIALLKDIPAYAFKKTTGPIPEWETLAHVAMTATLSGLWDIEIESVQQVMPANNADSLAQFRNDWAIAQEKTPLSVVDFLNLIKKYDVV